MRRFLVVCSVVAAALAGIQDSQGITNMFRTNNGYGVASIAGVTSRNGRVSSISGVNIFPSGSNPFYIPAAQGRSAQKIPEPISFTKEENGKFTSAQIKYGPGSVSVTSVARSVFPEDSTKTKSASKMPTQSMFMSYKPTDMIFQDPFSAFSQRSLSQWFTNPNTFMIQQPRFQPYNSVRTGWSYSNINPMFNFWRR